MAKHFLRQCIRRRGGAGERGGNAAAAGAWVRGVRSAAHNPVTNGECLFHLKMQFGPMGPCHIGLGGPGVARARALFTVLQSLEPSCVQNDA
jgi:hypothetical protein